MGLLESLGLKKKTSKAPAAQTVSQSPGAKSGTGISQHLRKATSSSPATPLSRPGSSAIQRSVSNTSGTPTPPLQPRGLPTSGSFGSSISRRTVPASGPLAPTEYMRTTSEGQALELRSSAESEYKNERRRSMGAAAAKEHIEEDQEAKPPTQLAERILRRDDFLASPGAYSEIVDRFRGGSLRDLPSRYSKDLAGEAVTEPTAARVADRPGASNRRRNPSLETILLNMYGDESGTESSTSSAADGPKTQSTGLSRPGQLQQRPPEPASASKARSGLLPMRDWEGGPESEDGKGPGVREAARAPRSGQLAPRDFEEEQLDRGLSARARVGQVAPDQPITKKPGGLGQLAARDWNPPALEPEEAKVSANGRSQSGQLLAVTPGAAAERFRAGPRSMVTQRPPKDSLSGERQQKGAAQRRFSRNRGPTGIEPLDAPKASSWRDRTTWAGVGAGLGAFQVAIAEENENGMGSLKYREGPHLAMPAMPALSGLSSSHPPGMRGPASFSAYSTPSSSRPAPSGQSDKPPAAPVTASERLAASLAASKASVHAKKGTRSGVLQPVQIMIFGRKQEGVGDNVLKRPFANVREKYQLQMEELGSGRFGVIRMCVDRKSGEKLACKSISKARLKNVHLVMELCEGGELFDRILAKKRYSEPEAAIVCRTVVGVLRYLHALGYIHRDLKPENILLCSKDNDTSVKVIDFGVATSFRAGESCTEEVGTPFYLAPEVLRNCYGAEADIWSAGVVLYILLCGVPPFWAKDNEGIRAAIHLGKLDLASGAWKSISDSAKDLVRNMLIMNPSDRIKGDAILGEFGHKGRGGGWIQGWGEGREVIES